MDVGDLNKGMSNYFIVKMYLEAIFHHAREDHMGSVEIMLLEIFTKIFFYNQIISAYHKLMI